MHLVVTSVVAKSVHLRSAEALVLFIYEQNECQRIDEYPVKFI